MNKKSGLSGSSNDSLSDSTLSKDGMLSDDDPWFKESMQAHLDSKLDNLDYNVTSQLSAARYRALALEQTSSKTARSWFDWTNALGATAVLAIAVFLGMQFYPSDSAPGIDTAEQVAQQVLIEDLNLLSASDEIEFYQSVEFLEWMESNSG